MRRTRTALVILLVAALAGPAAPAAAATPTCDGRAATIVGTPNATVSGTGAADVIVSNGAKVVAGGNGSDRICMTGTPSSATISVDAGYGHDRVFIRTAVRRNVSADLGHGSDVYVGGPGRDVVHAAPAWFGEGAEPKDAGLDRIATGAGSDLVTVGQADLPTRDIVRLGQHSDHLTVIGVGAEGHVFAGNDGRDSLLQTWARNYAVIPDQPLTLDNTDEAASIDDQVVLRWDSFQDFAVDNHPAGVRFAGSHRPESIDSFHLEDASMGGNDDVMRHTSTAPIPGVLRGGAGRDQITAYGSSEGYTTADLRTGRIDYGSLPDDRPEVPFAGIEDLRVVGDSVLVIGDDGPNRLDGYGCTVTIRGEGGADRLLSTPDDNYDFGDACGLLRMFGGDDDDAITGGAGADELYGGTGGDSANGLAGDDLCRAERRRSCERS